MGDWTAKRCRRMRKKEAKRKWAKGTLMKLGRERGRESEKLKVEREEEEREREVEEATVMTK